MSTREDARRAADDLRELVAAVVVETVDRPEAVAERRAEPSRAGRRADDRERLEREPQAPRARAAADHHVDREVLHRRIEDLLDRVVQPVDLVDEEDVALVDVREDRREVAGALDRRAARRVDAHAELTRDDVREGRLAEAGRAVQQDVVGGLGPGARRLEEDREVLLDRSLADVLAEVPGSQARLDAGLIEDDRVGGDQARLAVHHRVSLASRDDVWNGCSTRRVAAAGARPAVSWRFWRDTPSSTSGTWDRPMARMFAVVARDAWTGAGRHSQWRRRHFGSFARRIRDCH